MQYPKITIITPSYNQAHFIEQTIDSVLSQNYPNLEYFIFDGASKDNSAKIIAQYAPHLAYWESVPDEGQTHAINKGLARATGTILNWLNSDDYYEPDALFKIADAFLTHKTQVVCAKSRIFRGVGKDEVTLYHSTGTDIYPKNLPKTVGWARIDQPETFFTREAIERVGALDKRFRYLMDRDLWVKYLLHFGLESIAQIEDVIVNFRHHEDSKTISQSDFFTVERHSLFWGLAVFYDCEEIANFITANFEIDTKFTIQNLPALQPKIAHQILHYYLLLNAEEAYVKRAHAKAKEILKFIDKTCLPPEDKKLYQKIKFRNQLRAWF